MSRPTHAEMLPAIRAENEAWRVKHLPRLQERDRLQAEKRAQLADIISRGLNAINATNEERALVFDRTGVSSDA